MTRRQLRFATVLLYLISLFGPWEDGRRSFIDVVLAVIAGSERLMPTLFFYLAILSVPAFCAAAAFSRSRDLLLTYRVLVVLASLVEILMLLTGWRFGGFRVDLVLGSWGMTLYYATLLGSVLVEFFPVVRPPEPRKDPGIFR